MALKLSFKFKGKCTRHSNYNPASEDNAGQPKDRSCPGCETLRALFVYNDIMTKKVERGEGIVRTGKPVNVFDELEEPEEEDEPEPEQFDPELVASTE